MTGIRTGTSRVRAGNAVEAYHRATGSAPTQAALARTQDAYLRGLSEA